MLSLDETVQAFFFYPAWQWRTIGLGQIDLPLGVSEPTLIGLLPKHMESSLLQPSKIGGIPHCLLSSQSVLSPLWTAI